MIYTQTSWYRRPTWQWRVKNCAQETARLGAHFTSLKWHFRYWSRLLRVQNNPATNSKLILTSSSYKNPSLIKPLRSNQPLTYLGCFPNLKPGIVHCQAFGPFDIKYIRLRKITRSLLVLARRRVIAQNYPQTKTRLNKDLWPVLIRLMVPSEFNPIRALHLLFTIDVIKFSYSLQNQ